MVTPRRIRSAREVGPQFCGASRPFVGERGVFNSPAWCRSAYYWGAVWAIGRQHGFTLGSPGLTIGGETAGRLPFSLARFP